MEEQQYNNYNGNNEGVYNDSVYQNQQVYQPYQQNNGNVQTIPEKYKPIKAWGYVGYNLLFAIPLVGFIINLVFCFSDKNINRRNYARSIWCGVLISLIVGIIAGVLIAALGLSAEDLMSEIRTI